MTNGWSEIFLGVIAAATLLMAPASGEETRRVLAEKAREGRERATEAAARGREVVNRGRETVATALERGREAYQQARTSSPTSTSREGA